MTVVPTNVLLAMRSMYQATGKGERKEGSESDEEKEGAAGEEEATSFTGGCYNSRFL